MRCECLVCNGRDWNREGCIFAEKEIIPFFKQELLKLKYPTHPFPIRYKGLFSSILCLGQAIVYDRYHGIIYTTYYTNNKLLLKYSKEISSKFGMSIVHRDELKTVARLVCEFNVEPD